MSKWRYWAISAALLWLALIVRTADLYSLPLYHDEADHLRWAQFYALGQPNYPIFMDGKFFLGVTVAQFQVNGPESIWVARAVVAIFSMLAVSASIGIGNLLGGRRLGWLAGLVYALLPLSAFYERQIIADSLMAAFGACGALFTLRLMRTGQRRWIIAAGVALALSFVSKFFGILFWAYPAVAAMAYATLQRFGPPAQRPHKPLAILLNGGLVIGLTALLVAGILFWQRPMLGYNNDLMLEQKVGHVTCPPLLCQGDLNKQLGYFQAGLNSLGEIAPLYFGWPLVILVALSGFAASAPRRLITGIVIVSTFGMLIAFSSANYILPARYLVFLAFPVSVLGAAGARWLLDRVPSGPARLSAVVVLVALNLWPVVNSYWLITAPEQAAMPYDDRVNYITGPIAGTGMLQAARDIQARETGNPTSPVIVVAHGFKEQLNQILVHFDVTKVKAVVIDNVNIHDVGVWLTSGTPVYIFDAIKADPNIQPGTDGLYPGLTR